MISVIIPTMARCINVSRKLISTLLDDPSVGEIIIINNSNIEIQNNYNEKIKIYKPDVNLFVNPSWNFAIEKSKHDYIALINDDLLICNNYLSKIFNLIDQNTGIIGADINHIKTTYNQNDFDEIPDEKDVKLLPVNERTYAFGIFMVGKKTNFCKIPDNLKVWCGDDMFVKYNIDHNRQNYVAQGPIIVHAESLTSRDPFFDSIKESDVKIYQKLDKNFWCK